MTEGIRLFLVIATCYRISYLIAKENGPLGMFSQFRKKLAIMSADAPSSRFKKSLAELFYCPFCIGVWLSALLSVVYFLPSIVSDVLLVIFGIAGSQHFLQSLVGVGEEQ